MDKSQLAAMSGEATYRSPRSLELNEVSLNGDTGSFRKKLLVGKPKDQKPEEEPLGNRVEVVFLKIRRRLVERSRKGEIVRSTNEHNTAMDTVVMYETEGRRQEVGIAADLRKKYEGLRTVQQIYALLLTEKNPPELVRLIVKGASLGSEAKAKETDSLYSYFGKFGKDEHLVEYKTILTPVMEQGAKSYYCIDFKKGEKLSEEQLNYAVEQLKAVHEKCVEMDAARQQKTTPKVADIQVDEPAPVDGIDYPDEDIKVDEIPF